MNTKFYRGAVIKKFRKQASMSQAQLARAMGMARTTIVAIEQDKRAITDNELGAFESALFIDKGSLSNAEILPTTPHTSIHINFGYRVGTRERGEKCFNCGDKSPQFYYTYFGAPLCAHCWDTWWLTTEDGQTDPPSNEINNRHSGVWL